MLLSGLVVSFVGDPNGTIWSGAAAETIWSTAALRRCLPVG